MRIHRLKTLPPYFEALLDGRKTFDVRRDDRAFSVGDLLCLEEYEPPAGKGSIGGRTGRLTGRGLEFRVSYVMRGGRFGIDPLFCVLGLAPPETTEEG